MTVTQNPVDKVIDLINNPQNINPEAVGQTDFTAWADGIDAYRNAYKKEINRIPRMVNPDLKEEVRQKAIQQESANLRQGFEQRMINVRQKFESQEQSLLNDIKSKKFPAYTAKAKTYDDTGTGRTIITVHDRPDVEMKLVGAAELQQAAQTPVKNINVQMLQSYLSAGRTDLVSALCERAAQNMVHLRPEDRVQVEDFIKRYYDHIGISDKRKALRKIQALRANVINSTGHFNYDTVRVHLAHRRYLEALNFENFLEY